MPCDSSHLEPTYRERESKRVAGFIVYLKTKLNIWVLMEEHDTARSTYGNLGRLDKHTAKLCELCALPEAQPFIYDAHNRDARDLADWWEDHQEADKAKQASDFRCPHCGGDILDIFHDGQWRPLIVKPFHDRGYPVPNDDLDRGDLHPQQAVKCLNLECELYSSFKNLKRGTVVRG